MLGKRDRGGLLSFSVLAVALALLAPTSAPPTAAAPAAAAAPGGPGALSHFDLARKDCLGTARNTRLEGLVHGGRRRAVRRLQPDDRQHQRRDPAVRRHRRADVHRPAEPGHDVHGAVDRPQRDGLPGREHREERAYRLVTDYVTDPRPRRRGRHAPGWSRPRATRPEGLRPVRRDGQRQRRWRVEQRRRRRRRRGPGHHRAGQLGPEHRDQRGEPRLRGPAVRRAARRPAVPGRPAAGTPAPPATGWPSSTPTGRWPRRTTRRPTATSCRPGRSTSAATGGSRWRSASGTTQAGDRRRRRVGPRAVRADLRASTRRPGGSTTSGCGRRRRRSPGCPTRRPTGSARRTGCRRTC